MSTPPTEGWEFAGSKGAVNRAGQALADGARTPEHEECLRAYERYCEEIRADVDTRLRAMGFAPTSRLKARPTLADKLRRNRMNLTKVQDVVGSRIVLDPDKGRFAQRATVRRIEQGLSDLGPKVLNRIAEPMFGYRAVHVIVKHRGVPLEIQIRTHLQDQWAQIFEALADVLGRGVRYGEPPSLDRLPPERQYVAAEIIDAAMKASDAIDYFERVGFDMEDAFEEFPEDFRQVAVQSRDLIEGLLGALGKLSRTLEAL